EGEIPAGLRGSLYRNGPGLFERGASSIHHLLDGDGLVQRLSFSDEGVRYQNKFVRTEKYEREEASGKREFSTWTTRKSSNPFENLGGGITQSQAGVTVYPVHGKILARDEVGPTYEIDAESLETLQNTPVGNGAAGASYKAHSKLDPKTGEWLITGAEYGRFMKVHAAIYGPDMTLRRHLSFEVPRQVYFHDFIATENHLIFVLHPCYLSVFPFLAGLKSLTDSFEWKGVDGNLIAVVSREGGEPRYFEAPGSYMWHALNAFETGDEIVTDFVSFDEPDHFIGQDALFKNIMQGRMGRAEAAGKIRRNRMDLNTGKLSEEILDDGNHEFPMIDGRVAMARHRVGYFSYGGFGGFNSGLKRVDYETGAAETFDFGALTHVGEPVFAEKPGGDIDEGWLIAQCLDGVSLKSFYAVFDAQSVGAGPIAKVLLDHHLPISFHGGWKA
ncbi:MAG: carotenoid oxygenase family protein, partial [Parvularculaceae bacterium]|nr:carotenoid oxygenase family protein [Parvularculaceae bacterium]